MKQNTIVIIDDDKDILLSAKMVLKKHYKHIICDSNPENIPDLLQKHKVDMVLLDMNFKASISTGNEGLYWLKEIKKASPTTQLIVMTAYGDIDLAVKAIREGASDFIVKPWNNERLLLTVKNILESAATEKKAKRLEQRQHLLSSDLEKKFADIIGESSVMKDVFRNIEKVAATDANILILGENGTGKELVARAIHKHSKRAKEIFVNVDLGAISETLFESELFGHKKGAFTDAREDRIGRFEAANGGSLFLDEIGNLSLPLQAKLLTAIQSREINPVGSALSLAIDVRLICATNMPLYNMVEENRFRQDLLYRINTVEIVLPPLREREGDITRLANYYLERYATKYQKTLSIQKTALDKLERYNWPGNIRELQHVMERAVIMTDNSSLTADDFLLKSNPQKLQRSKSLNLEEVEKTAIKNAIIKHEGNMSKVAKELGLGRTTLYRKMTKYDL